MQCSTLSDRLGHPTSQLMVPSRSFVYLLSALTFALGFVSLVPSPTPAQDRSVPRFGPLVEPDTIKAEPSDLGRLWSFARPPLDYFEEEYGIRADERGLKHARLGTVRLPGCSGALVSGQGLVLTAARCVQSFRPSSASDSLRSAAFYAASHSEERVLPRLYAERLVEIEDVTAAVESAGLNGREQVEARMREAAPTSQTVEVVPEAGGARFVAYTYRRIEDVRLVFLPELMVTALGQLGEPLTYPQHAWDVAAIRLYDDDEPLQTPQHLEVGERGARPGDAVFALAHPSETRRIETQQQLAFRRDVHLPARTAVLESRATHLQQYVDTSSADGAWADQLADVRVELRRTRARLESLRNEYLMARLQDRDQQLRQVRAADTTTSGSPAGLLDRLAGLQSRKRARAESYRAFWFLLYPEYTSPTLRRAVLVRRAQADRLSSEALDDALQAVPTQPMALDAAALASHLQWIREHLAADSVLMHTLQELGPATSLIQESVFSDSAQVRAQIEEGRIAKEDPLWKLAGAIDNRFSDFEASWSDLRSQERQLTDSLSRIRHQVPDLPVTLPTERTLRMADGRIAGYPYNGTLAPAFTTFYGLYGHHSALRSQDGSALPRSWQTPSAAFERATPLTTVASTDLGAGAYGGPLLNSSLQMVGLVFDGNVQSAAGQYLFLPRRMRTVAVDVRGVIEGLTAIYGADGLVQEMTETGPSQ